MGDYINNLKDRFKGKNILTQIIIVNIALFLLLAIIQVVSTLFNWASIDFIRYIGVSSDIHILIRRPWTLVTYTIAHSGVMHILFNMLLLFWFGQLFLNYFTPKNLGSLYLLGGLAGAVLYVVAFNTIPYYVGLGSSYMIGASASVMAVIFGVAFYKPNLEIRLLFIGGVKIVYIAAFIFILDFISLGSASNPGGHLSHIGGAIVGYVFAKQYMKGKDITRWISKLMDVITNLFKPRSKSKMKVKYKRPETDYDYNQRRKTETEQIDHILDKIKASGYASLSTEEKKRLFDASKK